MKIKIACLILARGGSKGIPGKNIKLLAGKPLLSYVIKEAKKCTFFDGIYVSTEDQEIADVAYSYYSPVGPLLEIIKRPPELATDTTKSIDAVGHALKSIQADIVVLVNACCPLTKAEDMAECVKIALETKCDSVVSLVESFESHPSKVCKLSEEKKVVRFIDDGFLRF